MASFRDLRRRSRAAFAALLGAVVVGYFGYHAVHGDRGLNDWFVLSGQITELQKKSTLNQAQIAVLERRVALLRDQSLDPDMLDERVRAVLGFGRGDEIVVLGR